MDSPVDGASNLTLADDSLATSGSLLSEPTEFGRKYSTAVYVCKG